MITLTQRVYPHPDVVDAELEEQETVLLHLERQLYYTLNCTGTRIWRGVKDGAPLGDISRRLQAEFAVEAERADDSVLALVNELLEHKLAVPETKNP